jgi:hypothetical protein
MVLGDSIFCGGFDSDGYAIDVFLCVSVRFLCILLCVSDAMPSSTTLVSQAMVWRQTWRSFGGCINGDGVSIDLLSLQGNSGGRVRSFLARLTIHLPVCLGWCIQIPLVGLLFVVWGWTVRQLA